MKIETPKELVARVYRGASAKSLELGLAEAAIRADREQIRAALLEEARRLNLWADKATDSERIPMDAKEDVLRALAAKLGGTDG